MPTVDPTPSSPGDVGPDPSLGVTAAELQAEYAGQVSSTTVWSVVRHAREDLRGQVPEDGLAELLYRLADLRLSVMTTGR